MEFVLELLNLNLAVTKDSSYYQAVILVTPGVVSFANENNLSVEDLTFSISSPAANLIFRKIGEKEYMSGTEKDKKSYIVYCKFIEI